MTTADSETTSAAAHAPRPGSWLAPGIESQGLPRYIEMVREGLWLVILIFVLCLGSAVLYLGQADKVYKAEADLLVNPFPRETIVIVPGLVYESSDPTRDVETVSRLATTPAVVRLVQRDLKLTGPTKDVLKKVSVEPIAQSDIVAITAEAATGAEAQRLANSYGKAIITYRTNRMRDTIEPLLKALRARNPAPGDPAAEQIAAQRAFLEGLADGNDPTVRLESLAELPTDQATPRPVLTLASAILGGLVLGLVGAFGLSLLDPRLRREEQLRQRFRLPILARIPLERRRRGRPLLPQELSLGALDSYQALRAALTTTRHDALNGRVILVTGPSPGDGKTTAAINLASTLAAAGKRRDPIEADSRRPSIGRALGVRPEHGLASVITGRTYLVDALMPVGGEDSKLRVLLTSPDEAPAADVLSHLSADTLLLQAQQLADWVIVDSPPLNHVAETMALAQLVDDVLIVVRIGKTNMRDLSELAEMLAQQDIEPTGFVVLGGQARAAYY